MRESIADIARRLDARGLCVIPIPTPDGVHDGKRPVIAWAEYQTRRPTDDELAAWFPPGAAMNLAVVTGTVSGLVVVDLDDEAARQWWIRHRPYTPWQVVTGRGRHLYYRHPGVPVPNRARLTTSSGTTLAIDVRGDGGYVIGPGSRHASGYTYDRAGDWFAAREDLPLFRAAWLARPERTAVRRSSAARSTTPADVLERARRYLAAIPRPEIGQGSDVATLYAACRLVRGFALDADTTADLLWDWCGGRSGWTYAWVRRKVAHAERYGSEAVGALT